jgi:hypothetical protein
MDFLAVCSSFLKRAAAKLNRHLGLGVQQTYLYQLSKPEAWSLPAATDERMKWELLPRAQVGQLRDLGPFDVNEGLQRLDRGDRCYTVSLDGRLAHYSWVQRSASHPITEAGLSVPVGAGEAWIYHCVTVDWARGRRIYPATLQRIVRDCFAEGDHTAWIYTSTQNIPSQKGILRAGFGLVATLDAVRMGSRYLPIGRRNEVRRAPAVAESARALNEIAPSIKEIAPNNAVAGRRRNGQANARALCL